MSLNQTEPVLVKIAPNIGLDSAILLAGILIFFAVTLAFFVFYKPRVTSFKIKKKPDGTYSLQYGWGWHNFGNYHKEEFATVEQLKEKVSGIIEKTEWKPD